MQGHDMMWYARELGLAPKYLSEISKDITDRLHFSFQAMLTRYMKRTVGKTPTEYRKQIIRQ